MAKFSETNVSLRLNRIPTGATVDLHNFDRRGQILTAGAKFIGWFDKNDNAVESPKVIKTMDKENVMKFEATNDDGSTYEITLVKDKNGFGAMFLETTVGEGEAKKDVSYRITAYASKELVESTRVTAAPKKKEETVSSGIEVETNEVPTEE